VNTLVENICGFEIKTVWLNYEALYTQKTLTITIFIPVLFRHNVVYLRKEVSFVVLVQENQILHCTF